MATDAPLSTPADRLAAIQARLAQKESDGYRHGQAMDDLAYLLARLKAAEAVCKQAKVYMNHHDGFQCAGCQALKPVLTTWHQTQEAGV